MTESSDSCRLVQPKPQVYTRESTGLVRALGAKDIFVWTIVFFPFFASWVANFWYTPSLVDNVNYYVSLGLWTVLFCVIPPFLWWMMTTITPRSGGDYVFASRGLHPSLGFAASLGVTFSVGLTAIGSAPLFGLALGSAQLVTAGQVSGNSAITNLGNFLNPFVTGSAENTVWVIGLVILAIGAIIAAVGTRFFNKMMWIIFAIGLLGLVIELPILLTTTKAAFDAGYLQYNNATVASVYAAAASSPSHYLPVTTIAASVAAVPLLFINFGPYYLMYNVAGEVKNARRSFLYGAWGAILLSAAMAFLLTFLLDRAVGLSFIEAYTVANGYYAPVVSSFFAYVVPNLGVNVALAVVLLVSEIGFGYLGFMFLSRPMLAWSFDRILPSGLARVNSRFSSPVVAIVATLVLACCGWTLELYNSSFAGVILDSLLIKFVGWAIISAAAIALPFTQKKLFRESSASYKVGGIPVLSLAGLASFLVFGYFVVNSITTTVFYTPTWDQGAFLLVLYAGAVAYYFLARAFRRSQGVDISTAFKELPPE
jgi:basic amino acid/polyamine antiporter, APA family